MVTLPIGHSACGTTRSPAVPWGTCCGGKGGPARGVGLSSLLKTASRLIMSHPPLRGARTGSKTCRPSTAIATAPKRHRTRCRVHARTGMHDTHHATEELLEGKLSRAVLQTSRSREGG